MYSAKGILLLYIIFFWSLTASGHYMLVELLKLRPLLRSNSSFSFKAHTPYQGVWAHTLKVAILTSYKLSVGYFELNLAYHSGTPETYFTSCKKEHNRSPLMCFEKRRTGL